MKFTNVLLGLVGLIILVAIAYVVNMRNLNSPRPIPTSDSSSTQEEDMSIHATFNSPVGWEVEQASNAVIFRSPDLKYSCGDNKLYTFEQMQSLWSANQDFGSCFRAAIAGGSQISVINQGDMGLANYTLQSIPNDFTDGNNGNTVKNIQYIKVDGYDAVSWEDSYGDSPETGRTVAIIKDHGMYMISQSWKFGATNPYPKVMDNIIASFKFTD